MKSVALHNLGCKVNSYEMDVMQQMLQEKGYKVVPFVEDADIYIINTCTVTNIADRKSRQMLHRAKKNNPNAIVVATGCYVQTGQESIKKDDCVDLAIGNNRKKDLITILEDYIRNREKVQKQQDIIDINHTEEYEEMQLVKTAEHTRAYIKIQDGCNQFCSYCIIPFARGRVRSRKEEHIVKEISELVQQGYKEFVITGIHLCSYGVDFTDKSIKDYLESGGENTYLLDILQKIHGIEGVERLRLGSLEPRIMTEAFVEALSKMPKLCGHFHLSLQSGCNETLRRMNRHYSAEQYYEKVVLLRKVFSHPAITTDVIVGFPGEDEAEFQETYRFLQKLNLFEMHVFKYSKRQGTVAASMKEQLTEAQKAERSDILMNLTKEQSKDFLAYYVGKEVDVLIEEEKIIEGQRYQLGHTREYVKAALLSDRDLSNTIYRGMVERFLTDEILLVK